MRISITARSVVDFDALARAQQDAVEEAVRAGTVMVANDAKRAVAQGPKTGRVYNRHGVEHQASAPGEPPATDTGRLIGSIVTDVEPNGPGNTGPVGAVEARVEYAAWLEFGTRRIAPRPFLRPALERNMPRIREMIQHAVATAAQSFVRRATRG
jgi:HK97 gp10 family phage protein